MLQRVDSWLERRWTYFFTYFFNLALELFSMCRAVCAIWEQKNHQILSDDIGMNLENLHAYLYPNLITYLDNVLINYIYRFLLNMEIWCTKINQCHWNLPKLPTKTPIKMQWIDKPESIGAAKKSAKRREIKRIFMLDYRKLTCFINFTTKTHTNRQTHSIHFTIYHRTCTLNLRNIKRRKSQHKTNNPKIVLIFSLTKSPI